MNSLQNTMAAAVSIALSLALMVATVVAFVFPFVIAAGTVSHDEIYNIAAMWLMGSAGLFGVFVALHR